MKKFALYILVCLFGIAWTDMGAIYAQNTAAEKSVKTNRNVNFSKKSSNPANHLNKGGHYRILLQDHEDQRFA